MLKLIFILSFVVLNCQDTSFAPTICHICVARLEKTLNKSYLVRKIEKCRKMALHFSKNDFSKTFFEIYALPLMMAVNKFLPCCKKTGEAEATLVRRR